MIAAHKAYALQLPTIRLLNNNDRYVEIVLNECSRGAIEMQTKSTQN